MENHFNEEYICLKLKKKMFFFENIIIDYSQTCKWNKEWLENRNWIHYAYNISCV